MEDLYFIMSDFPLLSTSEDVKEWSGFITTKSRAIRISLVVPKFPSAEDVSLNPSDLNDESQKYWTSVLKHISLEKNTSFLEYLRLIEQLVLSTTGVSSARVEDDIILKFANVHLYSTVIEEIEAIGVKHVAHLSPDFRDLTLKHVDASYREHRLKVSIPAGYPDKEPTVHAELPFPKNQLTWPKRIVGINKVFLGYLENCCRFWNDMEELDGQVKVIEPIQPNASHYHRKILLEDNVIIHLTFNPLAPKAMPAIGFSGPEKLVDSFTERVDQDCELWNESDPVLENLRSILGCTFITAVCNDDEENNEPCTICYVYEFEGEIPDVSCVCGSSYHGKCLHDLLISDINMSKFRRMVQCPSCQLEIRVPTIYR